MICQHCATGGDLTKWPAATVKATRKLAVAQHEQCRGGTWCDCRHVVPSLMVLAKRRAERQGGGLQRIAQAFGA